MRARGNHAVSVIELASGLDNFCPIMPPTTTTEPSNSCSFIGNSVLVFLSGLVANWLIWNVINKTLSSSFIVQTFSICTESSSLLVFGLLSTYRFTYIILILLMFNNLFVSIQLRGDLSYHFVFYWADHMKERNVARVVMARVRADSWLRPPAPE